MVSKGKGYKAMLDNIQIEKKDSYPLSDTFISNMNKLLTCITMRWQKKCKAYSPTEDDKLGIFWTNKCRECDSRITDAEIMDMIVKETVMLAGMNREKMAALMPELEEASK